MQYDLISLKGKLRYTEMYSIEESVHTKERPCGDTEEAAVSKSQGERPQEKPFNFLFLHFQPSEL